MKGPRYDFSKAGIIRREMVPSPDAPAIIEQLIHELENEKLAVCYTASALAIDEYFERTGKERPEDIQF
jgi:hypothetical protein